MATKQQSRYILFTAATMVPRSSRFSSLASGSRSRMEELAPKMKGRQFSTSSQKES